MLWQRVITALLLLPLVLILVFRLPLQWFAIAVAAIKISYGPIGIPFLSSFTRIWAAEEASARPKGSIATKEANS